MIKRLCVFLLAGLAAGHAQTVNCLVAVVNGQAITLTDVRIVAEFGLYAKRVEEADKESKFATLDALIDRKVVLEMTRELREVGEEELVRTLGSIREELGGDEFTRKLRTFGLLDSDLFPYVEEKILFEQAAIVRFNQNLPVSGTEVERYYREVYVPEQTQLGEAAAPLGDIANVLETRIRERNRTRQVTEWIKGLRDRAEIRIKKDCLE